MSGFPDEDCKWMWLWRTFLKGTAEGATRAKRFACQSLRQKDRDEPVFIDVRI
ncbi:hypothetical protein BUFA31_00710 [Butyricicoccus faecihominis]|uniref:Uncharacterized protein n=1 Tax=Butyricicoccus faecihominis TaxID=1712515 RepID=A0ABQ1DVY8_9FIRM|nr:hypothetical protein BUFA31_00710 [Butyricicoccus faecihominis]GGM71182.1 hypothetical protein GCM10007040_13000 [Butyricicoccus faecihominis]